MPTVDPTAGPRAVQARLDATTNPRHRKMLETLKAHLAAEADGSLDGLMATLVPDPQYRMWANGADYGPKGYDAVKAYYTQLVAARRGHLEYAIERIVVDDDNVVTEGFINAYQPGPAARAFGFNVDRLDATYLVAYRAILVWPFDDEGRLVGEEGYATFNPDSAVAVAPGELPDAYVRMFDPSEYATVGIGPR
jgi:hypothetical protein